MCSSDLPSPDVEEKLEALIVESGRTGSAIIDEGLRRVFWSEKQYTDVLHRNFGGKSAFVKAYLVARTIAGIEHEMQGRADSDIEIADETTSAIVWLVEVKFFGEAARSYMSIDPLVKGS